MNLVLWLIGTALLTLLYGLHDPRYIPNVGFVMLFCGIVVSAACYLFTEFALRPIAARAHCRPGAPGRLPSKIGRIMKYLGFAHHGDPGGRDHGHRPVHHHDPPAHRHPAVGHRAVHRRLRADPGSC